MYKHKHETSFSSPVLLIQSHPLWFGRTNTKFRHKLAATTCSMEFQRQISQWLFANRYINSLIALRRNSLALCCVRDATRWRQRATHHINFSLIISYFGNLIMAIGSRSPETMAMWLCPILCVQWRLGAVRRIRSFPRRYVVVAFFFCGNKKLKYSWSRLKSSNQQQQRQQAWKSIGRHLLNRISSNFIACIYNWQQQSNIRRDTMCRRPTGRPEHGKLCVNINFVAKITCNYRCRHIGGDATVYGGMLEVTATTACVRFNH